MKRFWTKAEMLESLPDIPAGDHIQIGAPKIGCVYKITEFKGTKSYTFCWHYGWKS